MIWFLLSGNNGFVTHRVALCAWAGGRGENIREKLYKIAINCCSDSEVWSKIKLGSSLLVSLVTFLWMLAHGIAIWAILFSCTVTGGLSWHLVREINLFAWLIIIALIIIFVLLASNYNFLFLIFHHCPFSNILICSFLATHSSYLKLGNMTFLIFHCLLFRIFLFLFC